MFTNYLQNKLDSFTIEGPQLYEQNMNFMNFSIKICEQIVNYFSQKE